MEFAKHRVTVHFYGDMYREANPRLTSARVLEVSTDEDLRTALHARLVIEPLPASNSDYQTVLMEGAFEFLLLAPGKEPSDVHAFDGTTRLEYVIDSDGSVRRFRFYDRPTFGDMTAVLKADYGSGDATNLIAFVPEGFGASANGYSDLLEWLLQNGVEPGLQFGRDLLFAKLFRWGPLALRSRQVNLRARRVVRAWEDNSLGSPRQLRDFLELKSSWTSKEVSRRLQVSERSATTLLRALGFAENTVGVWIPGTRKKQKARLQRWLDNESNWSGSDRVEIAIERDKNGRPLCPRCETALQSEHYLSGTFWACPTCGSPQYGAI